MQAGVQVTLTGGRSEGSQSRQTRIASTDLAVRISWQLMVILAKVFDGFPNLYNLTSPNGLRVSPSRYLPSKYSSMTHVTKAMLYRIHSLQSLSLYWTWPQPLRIVLCAARPRKMDGSAVSCQLILSVNCVVPHFPSLVAPFMCLVSGHYIQVERIQNDDTSTDLLSVLLRCPTEWEGLHSLVMLH